jgi:hypothetical protein
MDGACGHCGKGQRGLVENRERKIPIGRPGHGREII